MNKFAGKCPACGSTNVKRTYNGSLARLECQCMACYYDWVAWPLFADEQEPQFEPQPEADAEQVICDSIRVSCPIKCVHSVPHARCWVCHHFCSGTSTDCHCIPVPQPEQPELPLPMKPVSIAPRISTTLALSRYSNGDDYCIRRLDDSTDWPSGTWADMLALARWIIEQEEARHARP